MTFDSLEFLIFFAAVYVVYFFLQNNKSQTVRNLFLLVTSYFFYGFWSPPFVILIVISTLVDFYLAQAIQKAVHIRLKNRLLAVSVIVNLGFLGFFKYFNFFIDSALMVLPHDSFIAPSLEVILPVGISFYTFQSMSYSIDVYRNKVRASDSLIDFALYVAFFPQLVAGPIERAAHMLPQFERKARVTVSRTLEGIDLCLRGYFKKIVIADNIAPLANFVFGDVDSASTLSLWIASYAFAIQIYTDFSAYTDIARGTSKLLGFELMKNFDSPYRSLNVSEFWKRWHISLSTWLRDYLYIPLGGNQVSQLKQVRNLFLVMALGGLWHGASWNFILWGVFHGVLLGIYHTCSPLLGSVTSRLNHAGKRIFKFASWFLTFHLVCISWVIFRVKDIGDIATALNKMLIHPVVDFSRTGLAFIPNAGPGEIAFYMTLITGAMLAQFGYFGTKFNWSNSLAFRGARGAFSLAFIFLLYPTVKEQFIYFQF